jgi:hypothetical protein
MEYVAWNMLNESLVKLLVIHHNMADMTGNLAFYLFDDMFILLTHSNDTKTHT